MDSHGADASKKSMLGFDLRSAYIESRATNDVNNNIISILVYMNGRPDAPPGMSSAAHILAQRIYRICPCT